MEPYILPLVEVEAGDLALVGGKALHLAELLRVGFQVPEAFCVTTESFRLFLQEAGIESLLARPDWEERVNLLQEAIRAHPLPATLQEALERAYRDLGVEQSVAVRSSATSEDLPESSFAGQYDTHLNVRGLGEVLEKLKACWVSLWSARALAYLHRQGLSPQDVAMGVIVQRQISAEASGVLFTLNPLTGREEEMLVEATWGLAEALVSGWLTPDRFVLDAWQERVRRREIADKRAMVVPDLPSGVKEVSVPEGKRRQPALTDKELRKLLRLGYQVQQVYGYPQDIEWALQEGEFYALQTRPLTSYTFAPEIGQWTSANFREVMPGFITPFSFSINGQYEWGRGLEELFLRMKMMRERREVEWGRLFFGRAYWNVGEVKRLASQLPGFVERDFDESSGVEPTYEGDGLVTPLTPSTILRGLPILFALQRLYRNVWREALTYQQTFFVEGASIAKTDLVELSDAELAEQVRCVLDFHHRTNRVALLVSFLATQAQDDFSSMLANLNKRHPQAQPLSMARLLTGLREVNTARPILELWKLSQEVLKFEVVAQVIREAEPEELEERLGEIPDGRAFWQRLREYIQEFRYMAENDEDMSLPRWDEDSTFVFVTLRCFLQEGGGINPEELIARQGEVRRREEGRAAELLSRSWLARLLPVNRWLFFRQLEILKRYSWWREETRPMLSLAHYHCRRALVERGRRWAKTGYLEDQQDIFFLTLDQVLAALEGELSSEEARTSIAKYKRLRRCYRNFKPPPTIGRDVRPEEGLIVSKAAKQAFSGVACSAGRATGRARLVCSLGEAHKFQRGEILVAPHTNPGWVPLFNLAAGIVMEEGGLISHGAIVAREYGIPAVLQLRGATQLFKDGQMLSVDGDRGIVELLGEAE